MRLLLFMVIAALLAVMGPGSVVAGWVFDHLVMIITLVLLYCVVPSALLYLTEGHLCGEIDRHGRLLPCRAKRSRDQNRFAYEGRLCPTIQRQITIRRLARDVNWFLTEVGRVWTALCDFWKTCLALWREIEIELEPIYRTTPVYLACACNTLRSAVAYIPVSPFVFVYTQFDSRLAGPVAEICTSMIHSSKYEPEEWSGASLQEEYGSLVEKFKTMVTEKPSVKASVPNWVHKPAPRRSSETTKTEPQATISTIAPKVVEAGRKPTVVKPKWSVVKPKSTLAAIKPTVVFSKPAADASKPVAPTRELTDAIPTSIDTATLTAVVREPVPAKPQPVEPQLVILKSQIATVDSKLVPAVPKVITAAPSPYVPQSHPLVKSNLPMFTPGPMETKSESIVVVPNPVVASPNPTTSAAKSTLVLHKHTPNVPKPVVVAPIFTMVSPKPKTNTALRPICLRRQAALAAISQQSEETKLAIARPEEPVGNKVICSVNKEVAPLPILKKTTKAGLSSTAKGKNIATMEPTNLVNPTAKPTSSVVSMDVPSCREEVPKRGQTEDTSPASTAHSVSSVSSEETLASNHASSIFDQSLEHQASTSANTTIEDVPPPKSEPKPCFLIPLPTSTQLAELAQTTFNQSKDTRKDLALKSPKHKTSVRALPIYAPLLQLSTQGKMLASVITRAEQKKKHAIRKAKLVRRLMRAFTVAAPVSLVKPAPCVSSSIQSKDVALGVFAAVEDVEPMVCDARLESEVPMDATPSVNVVPAPAMDIVEDAEPMDAQVTMEVSVVPQAPAALSVPTLVAYSPMITPARPTVTIPAQPAHMFSTPAPRVSAFPPVSAIPREAHETPFKPMDTASCFKSQKPKRVQPGPDAKLATAPSQPGACRPLGRVEAPRAVAQKQVIWSLDKDGKEALPENGVVANTYIWRRDPSLGTPAVRVRAPKMFLVVE